MACGADSTHTSGFFAVPRSRSVNIGIWYEGIIDVNCCIIPELKT